MQFMLDDFASYEHAIDFSAQHDDPALSIIICKLANVNDTGSNV